MPVSEEVFVRDVSDLMRFAKKLASQVQPPATIGLSGPLGVGKTTFVKCFLEALGSNSVVSSPTFNLMHEYALPASGYVVEHCDLYRVKTFEDLHEPPESNVIRLIEWIELDAVAASSAALIIEFSFAPEAGSTDEQTSRCLRLIERQE